ncbi:hypothetical protein [Microbacterium invictum]|uniref:Uncharacterized protein n=1 Tax=Microbacterium invictum TaxID=515415 RepID=A0ABZ0VEV5_9MICO|nr:hypothetical protein [Microbacterium invictum]WQB71463.1 hypothetical protein T9R20_05740 [Microbacterium invictum]
MGALHGWATAGDRDTGRVPSRIMRVLAVAGASLAITGALSGCGIVERIAADGQTPTPTPTAPIAPTPTGPDPVLAWECGQISALSGVAIRTNFEYQTRRIDEVEYVSRLQALQDAWVYMPTYDTEITPFIYEVQVQAAADPSGSNQGYIDAINAATAACQEAGSLAVITPLPEMGG